MAKGANVGGIDWVKSVGECQVDVETGSAVYAIRQLDVALEHTRIGSSNKQRTAAAAADGSTVGLVETVANASQELSLCWGLVGD